MSDIGKVIQNLISDDQDLIIYRPTLRSITKTMPSAILLTQILYWTKKQKGKFYKFKLPCDNPQYSKGDSWCEELNISREEFDSALKNIGCKKPAKNKPQDTPEMQEALIWYSVDMSRLTWYEVNTITLRKALTTLYDENTEIPEEIDDLRKVSSTRYVKREPHGSIYTENTTENTLNNSTKVELDLGKVREQFNGLVCKICGEKQFTCRSGASCKNGHGGVEGIKKKEKLLFTTGKIKTTGLTIFNYSTEAKQILKCWKDYQGRLHINGDAKGAPKIQTMIDELLMDGRNPYITLTDDPVLRMKKWTVQEICDCIKFYAGPDGLNKDIESFYFDIFVIRRYGGFKAQSRKDHSPLIESFKNLPEFASKWTKILHDRFTSEFPKAIVYSKSIRTISLFLESKEDDFKIHDPGNYGFLPNMFLSYMKKMVSIAGKYDPIKYMASQDNINKFWKGCIDGRRAVKRTIEEKKKWIVEKPLRAKNIQNARKLKETQC